jgi:uroporphyrinogen decarboxylase
MTARERVRTILARKEADRVPMDLWGCASRLHNKVYFGVLKELGLEGTGKSIRPGTHTEYEDYRISDALNVDFRHVNVGKPKNFKSHTDDGGNVIDEWGIGHFKNDQYNAISLHPLADPDPAKLDSYHWPDPDDPGRVEGIGELARDYYENTPYAVTATTATSGLMFDFGQYLCGAEQFFVNLYEEELFSEKLIDKLTEIMIRIHINYLRPIAPYIEWVELASDFGTQTGPFISMEMFRKYFKKPMASLAGAIKKEYPGMKVMLHSCGAMSCFIPDLIECGIDILNSLQPLARDMDSARLKREFGNDIILHSGVDIQQAMQGSAEDVEREARRVIGAMAVGGGYVFAPANHLQGDCPPANVVTLYRCGEKYGKYPIRV